MIGKLTENEEITLKEFSAELKSRFGENIKQILLFGSKARGDFTKESDIDVFILVKNADATLRKTTFSIVSRLLLKHEILLSPKIVEDSHFGFLKQLGTAFARNVEKDGIKI